ncbi:unnamed protein product (macronuclear) [Paramecium tetraurelia]|uniref:PHD-type domain-containing protein n=1 Tax=Paramecium tetraurelia TaxID=5888 RepID=A0CTN9_PARTE|nr:uncharacterized protein GSPATT00010390001 [Paramecium tetraurelia]CAK74156.1 unnamed protein product [Paramecium tetraurelia]|eukprot:XP_001441553.1 hypothetical protein (macronuclear) [Paramecium tetraurelia strain d4-2]
MHELKLIIKGLLSSPQYTKQGQLCLSYSQYTRYIYVCLTNFLDISALMNGIEMLSYLPNPGQSQPQLNLSSNRQEENSGRKIKNNAANPITITVEDDEPQQTTKKCYNVQCMNVGDKKIKSKRHDILFFCDKCSKLFNKGKYCDFCEQVYGSYDDEAGWVQCDQCQKWNHIACEQKYRNQNIENEPETTPYHCLSCSKNIKKTKPLKKSDEFPPPKQVPIPEQEDCKNKEKNITFVATKDNKIQYILAYRLNLFDDEIKLDLDLLRNSIKRTKKVQLASPPHVLQQHVMSSQQQSQQLQQQQETQEQQQLSSRSLRRRINQRMNYRDLVGEY